MVTDMLPGIDLVSTLFTLGYIVWLVSRELGFLGGSTTTVEKRSLMNQHVSSRGAAAWI